MSGYKLEDDSDQLRGTVGVTADSPTYIFLALFHLHYITATKSPGSLALNSARHKM